MDFDGRAALTVNEFAECVGLSRATAYRLIDKGYLRAFRFGDSRYLIPVGEVERIAHEADFQEQVAAEPLLTREARPPS